MSSRQGPGTLKQLWFRWKALRLPWRRQYLAGSDLAGNTFWEFKDHMNANRLRRMVKYSRAVHYSEVKISPQWHQWLRHTRPEPPTVQEQHYDVARQAQMKQLAARADERWKSQESFLDSPAQQQPVPALGVKDPGGYAPQTEPTKNEGVMNAVEDPEKVRETVQEGKDVDEGRFKGRSREKEPSPWAQPQRGAPSENWQPQSWTPGPARRG